MHLLSPNRLKNVGIDLGGTNTRAAIYDGISIAEKFYDVLVRGIGMNVIAIGPKRTPFTTIEIPGKSEYQSYLCLATGWNLLVEIGITMEINLDRPERARKIGNEYVEQHT
jgi:hypothetical protein